MLKSILTQTPLLTITDPSKRNIFLCIEISDLANGIVLMQDKQVVAMSLIS